VLTKRDLKALAKNATELREIFRDRAKEQSRLNLASSSENVDEVRRAGQQIRYRGSGKPVDKY